MNARVRESRGDWLLRTGAGIATLHIALCVAFSALWNWTEFGTTPRLFAVARMTVLLVVFFQFFPWFTYFLARRKRGA